jgi:hypothetical protein
MSGETVGNHRTVGAAVRSRDAPVCRHTVAQTTALCGVSLCSYSKDVFVVLHLRACAERNEEQGC